MRLAQVSPSIALGTAINIAKPTWEELQHQQNGKCSVTLCFLCFAHLDWVQAKQTLRVLKGYKGKVKEGGEDRKRDGSFETSCPNNQYLKSS